MANRYKNQPYRSNKQIELKPLKSTLSALQINDIHTRTPQFPYPCAWEKIQFWIASGKPVGSRLSIFKEREAVPQDGHHDKVGTVLVVY